jgi:uncharacterized OB-fold protein
MAERVPLREGTFIETPEGGALVANRCKACGQVFFPKARVCFSCFNEDMEEVRLSRRGNLYSYTIGRMPSLHFEPPYALGYIDMPEKVRIFAPLEVEQGQYGKLKIGMEMEVVVEKLWEEEGKEVIGWKFKPAVPGGRL